MPVVTWRPEFTTRATVPRKPRSEVMSIAENIVRTAKIVFTGPGSQVTQKDGQIIVILGRLGHRQKRQMQAPLRQFQEKDSVSRYFLKTLDFFQFTEMTIYNLPWYDHAWKKRGTFSVFPFSRHFYYKIGCHPY